MMHGQPVIKLLTCFGFIKNQMMGKVQERIMSVSQTPPSQPYSQISLNYVFIPRQSCM